MPIYEYKCVKCKSCFEKLIFAGDKEPVECPEGGTKMGNTANYRRNFYAFIWHALFLAFAATFIDVNTVLSSFPNRYMV
jgi:putative FmdB family regulatory protein